MDTRQFKGYIPHDGMGVFKCDECGGTLFTSYPQSMPAEKESRPWVYEYICVGCGHMMGLPYAPDDDS